MPHYDAIWREGQSALQSATVEIDATLARNVPDARRGLTLLLRPSDAVAGRVAALLDELRALEPEQHYYRPSELHVTVLSLFTATVAHQPFFDQQPRYVAAVRAALAAAPPFAIDFYGVTASRAALLLQGFPRGDALASLRERLRRSLSAAGLGQGLDQRYRLQTAHSTVLRFRAPLHQPQAFAARLERYRQQPFGTTTVERLALVVNDWYMSENVVRVIEHYQLK
jgi:2'-5' RNA ligase